MTGTLFGNGRTILVWSKSILVSQQQRTLEGLVQGDRPRPMQWGWGYGVYSSAAKQARPWETLIRQNQSWALWSQPPARTHVWSPLKHVKDPADHICTYFFTCVLVWQHLAFMKAF